MVRILTILHGIRSSGSTMVLVGRINAVVEQRVSGAGFECDPLAIVSLMWELYNGLLKAGYWVKRLKQFLSGTRAERNKCNPLRGTFYTGRRDWILSGWMPGL
jgi:hypothetical protein